jgi:hypothetical protein
MKKYQRILVIVFVVIVGLVFLKDALIKTSITTVGSSVLGAPIKIRSFALRAITQKVHIKDMVVYNPKGFPARPMVDMPEIEVNFDLGALLGGKLHLPLIVFDLKEVILIKDKDGKLNVDALKIAQTTEKPEQDQAKEKPKEKSKRMPMQVDELRLNIERVVYEDYSQGDKPVILGYDLAFKDKVFKDIKSPEEMATLIMLQAMGPATIQGAAIYGAATVLGVAFLPAGAVGVLVGNDSSIAEYEISYEKLYDISLALLKEIGELKSEDRASGVIKAKVNGNDIAIKMEKMKDQKIKVTVSARKMMLPKPEVAGGIQYQISEQI